jgi:IS5 family transposase
VDRNSLDPDARFGCQNPEAGVLRGQKKLLQDVDSELIVPVLTTPGNRPDGVVLPTLAPPQAQELTGGKAYNRKSNCSHLAALGMAPGLHPRRPPPGRPRKSWRERPQIERQFAACKQFPGLRHARYCGPAQVTVQRLMGPLVVNGKRWVTRLKLRSPAFSWANVA